MRLFPLLVLVACEPDTANPGEPCAVPGTICTVAGDDEIGLGNDGLPATGSSLYFPEDIAFDPDGNLVIVDFNNHRIRRVVDGVVDTLIGRQGVPGDGPEGPASAAAVNHPTGVAFHDGAMWIAGFHDARLYRIDLATGLLTNEAGDARRGYAGDGGPAVDAVVNQPSSVAFDDDGAVLFSDQGNQLVRRIAPDGTIARFAGTLGDSTCKGDGGPALDAGFGSLASGYAAPATRLARIERDLYLIDTDHGRIRVIDLDTGTIATLFGAEGCGAPPRFVVPLVAPSDLDLAADGALLISDRGASCVLAVQPDGAIDVVADLRRERVRR